MHIFTVKIGRVSKHSWTPKHHASAFRGRNYILHSLTVDSAYHGGTVPSDDPAR